jgi:hypothetical protein
MHAARSVVLLFVAIAAAGCNKSDHAAALPEGNTGGATGSGGTTRDASTTSSGGATSSGGGSGGASNAGGGSNASGSGGCDPTVCDFDANIGNVVHVLDGGVIRVQGGPDIHLTSACPGIDLGPVTLPGCCGRRGRRRSGRSGRVRLERGAREPHRGRRWRQRPRSGGSEHRLHVLSSMSAPNPPPISRDPVRGAAIAVLATIHVLGILGAPFAAHLHLWQAGATAHQNFHVVWEACKYATASFFALALVLGPAARRERWAAWVVGIGSVVMFGGVFFANALTHGGPLIDFWAYGSFLVLSVLAVGVLLARGAAPE